MSQEKIKYYLNLFAKHEESGRYSFIAYDPIAELIGNKESYLFRKEGEEEKREGSVFQKLRDLIPISNESLPFSFFGGAIGYFSYDTAFYTEKSDLSYQMS